MRLINGIGIEKDILLQARRKDWLRKERSVDEIIHDMLAVILEEEKPKKTRIMRRTCLNCKSFGKYFDLLLEQNLIATCNSGKESYEVTEKGKELLKRLDGVTELLPLNKRKL